VHKVGSYKLLYGVTTVSAGIAIAIARTTNWLILYMQHGHGFALVFAEP